MSPWRVLSLWAPVAAFMGLLFFLSSRTDLGAVPTGWDKVAHTAAYGVLGLLALRACHGGFRALRPRPSLVAILVTVSYAALDELHQGRVVGRHASVLDWVADLAGSLLGVVFMGLLLALRTRLTGRGSVGETET